jgi:hypothetical protein
VSRYRGREPEIKPVRREDKIEEWTKSIKILLRHRDGTMLTDDVAVDYAEKFWRSLELNHTPVTEIMETSGIYAVNWAAVVHSWDLSAATEANVNDIEKPKEDPMKTSKDLTIGIGLDDAQSSVYPIINGKVLIKGDDGEYQSTPVRAELVIDHVALRRLLQKASDNRAKRSSDGPLTIRINREAPAKEG